MARNRHQLEFLASIGLDIENVVADDITNLGFYTFVVEPDGRRLTYHGFERFVREFHEWPNGVSDWEGFKNACRKDWAAR